MDILKNIDKIEVEKNDTDVLYAKGSKSHSLINGKSYGYYERPLNRIDVRFFNGLVVGATKAIQMIKYKYLEDYNVVEVSKHEISLINDPDNVELKDWNLIDYYFIDADYNCIYKKEGIWVREPIAECHNNIPFALMNEDYSNSLEFILSFTKLYGLICNGDDQYTFVVDPTDLLNNKKNKLTPPKTTKKLLKLANETLAHKLKEVTSVSKEERYYYSTEIVNMPKYAYIQKVTDDIQVIRYYCSYHCNDYEYMRYYITKDANFICVLDNDGQFHLKTTKPDKRLLECNNLVYNEKELAGTPLSYLLPLLNKDTDQAYELYQFFNYAILEKMLKTGYETLVGAAIESNKYARKLPTTYISSVFSYKINQKEKNLFKSLGVNKHQYNVLASKFSSSKHIINTIADGDYMIYLRSLLKDEATASINDIDDKTFDYYVDLLDKLIPQKLRYVRYIDFPNILIDLKKLYSIDFVNKILNSLIIIHDRSIMQILYFIRDVVPMLKAIESVSLTKASSFPLKFSDLTDSKKCEEEVQAWHDGITSVYNTISEESNKKQFANSVKKCAKWEYANEEYSVISPKEPGDLANEGLTLHHCVKSYIEKVITETTNIMFIRKNEDTEVPFFTVEINNKGCIEQIHGFGNRNVSTEPGLDKFVAEWSKAKKIKSSNYNKIR